MNEPTPKKDLPGETPVSDPLNPQFDEVEGPEFSPEMAITNDMKPFHKTAFGRTLAGRNKTGRIIHSVLDVAPLPNVHEVIKAVIKDEEAQQKVIGATELTKETFKRLDWLRTITGGGLVAAYLLDYISVEKATSLFETITQIAGGLF